MSRSNTYIGAGFDSRPSRGFRMVMAGSMCAALAGLASVRAEADGTLIRAASHGWGARNFDDAHGEESWWWNTPTSQDKIKMESSLRVEGGVSQPRARSETKFAFPGATGKTFARFGHALGPGSAGSTMSSGGVGNSYVTSSFGRTKYVAKWYTWIRGTLGTGHRPSFVGVMWGRDPFFITADGLAEAGVTEDAYDVTVGAGLDAATAVSGSGEIKLDVYYDVAEGTTNLLSIRINGFEISATNDDPPGLSFYRIDSMGDAPGENDEDLITLDEIRDLLIDDIGVDGVLDTPLYLGIVWEDIPVPTVELLPEQGHGYYVDGTVGMFRIESEAREQGAGDCGYAESLPWTEGFAGYEPGNWLIGQCGWKGWNGDPATDAIVAPDPSNQTRHSVDIQQNANVLREFEGADSGIWVFSAWQFVPSDFVSGGNGGQFDGSHLILLNTYEDNGPQNPSVHLQLDSNSGMLKVYHGDGLNTVDVPYIVDQWVPIEVLVDLDNDRTLVFYNEQPIAEYGWTAGTFGDGGGQPNIAAVDLFAGGSSSVFYDDMVLEPLLPGCNPADANCDGEINAFDIEPFLGLLFAGDLPCLACTGDVNGDGNIDAFDIEPFLGCLFP